MYDMTKEVNGESHRFNSQKAAMSNIPPTVVSKLASYYEESEIEFPTYAIEQLGIHYTLATNKYPDADAENGHGVPNWVRGQFIEKFLIDCMYRHLYKVIDGSVIDEDFGSNHYCAISWALCAMVHYFDNYKLYEEFDDRRWVGFNNTSGFIDTVKHGEEIGNILRNLAYLQTCDTIIECSYVAMLTLYNALSALESSKPDDYEITHIVPQDRIDAILETDYGEPNSATMTFQSLPKV